jgi:hypothetical protein
LAQTFFSRIFTLPAEGLNVLDSGQAQAWRGRTRQIRSQGLSVLGFFTQQSQQQRL